MIKIHGKEYVTVAERIKAAHEDEELVSITTEILKDEPIVVIKATATFKDDKGTLYTFTGISSANPEKAIEKSNPYEVAETSAVGRALGFAGYGITDSVASADEMNKAGLKADDEVPPPWISDEDEEVKVCSAHDVPVKMFRGISKHAKDANGNPKVYWWHKGENGQMCFGSGYKD